MSPADSLQSQELRLATYPAAESHVYLQFFYRGLSANGVRLTVEDTVASLLDPRRFRGKRSSEILCLHWPEYLWQADHTLRYLPWRFRWLASLRQVARVAFQLRRAHRQGMLITWTVHNLDPHEPDTFVDSVGQWVVARFADIWICHSEETRRAVLSRYGGASARAVVMPIGNFGRVFGSSTETKEALLGRLGLDPQRRTLLCFGVLRHYKGFDLAIKAMQLLGPEFQLVVAGRAWHPEIEQTLREEVAGVPNARLIVRALKDSEIGDLLRASDGAIFPYRRITGSAALLTALTEGVPVIAADLPYFREVLKHEPEAGVLYDPENVPALVGAIKEFFAVPAEIRRKAARRLAERFGWNEVVKQLSDELRTLASGKNRIGS